MWSKVLYHAFIFGDILFLSDKLLSCLVQMVKEWPHLPECVIRIQICCGQEIGKPYKVLN
jgi:hypothetical protein